MIKNYSDNGDVIWSQVHHHSYALLNFQTKCELYEFIPKLLKLQHPNVILETAIIDSTITVNIYANLENDIEKVKIDVEQLYQSG